MDFKIKHNKSSVVLYCGNEVLATINRELLFAILSQPKTEKPKTDIENKTQAVIKEYRKAWENYYNTVPKSDYRKGTKDYAHFRKAAAICIQHKAKARVFIKAQVDGLRFVNGTGVFPKPNQLSTPNAETRLLEAIKDASMDVTPVLTWEADTPLEKNSRYQEIIKKMKDNSATLKEARYALECEMKRRGQGSINTIAYVKVMEENAR